MHILKALHKKVVVVVVRKYSLEHLNPTDWWCLLNLILNKNTNKQLIPKLYFYAHQILSDQIYSFIQQLHVTK